MKEQEKIKVLMLGPDRSVHGGISGVVNNYYEAGLDQIIDLCYIGTMKEGSRVRKLLKAVCAFILFCVKVSGYQIVHVNMASDSSYYRKSVFVRMARIFRKKIVIHQHGGNFEDFYYRQLDDKGRRNVNRVLSMGDVLVVLSREWKMFFAQMVDETKIIVLPNAIGVPEAVKKIYGQHKILFLGRICRDKGIQELFEVIPDLRRKFPDIRVYLGGIWEDEKLRQQAEGLKDCVIWTGWITGKEKEQYLRDCDIFVLPTYFEGQPVSVLEAMSYGCAVIASETGGIPQMIIHGQTGLLIRPGDAWSLREAAEQALSDPELCRRLGENARRRAEKDFSIEQNMEELLRIYRRVLKRI